MKSFGHMYNFCISDENRKKAVHDAYRSDRIKWAFRENYLTYNDAIVESKNWIRDYENEGHKIVIIREGAKNKERKIIVPSFKELVVQHCVVNAMKPMFMCGMYEHSYASIPKRGTHKAKKVIEKWIKKDSENTRYCLKMDIRHFFESIPHNILKAKLEKKIKDIYILDLLFKIIDTTEIGLPLGFYTSQWLANWYLQDLDHFIKEKLHAKYYARYMDDMVIFGSSSEELHTMRILISDYLSAAFGLNLKSDWQVFRFSYGGDKGRVLDFMGFRFYNNRTTLRKAIMLKATRKAKRISKKERITTFDARQMLSYRGYLKVTNTYNLYLRYIKPYVSFKNLTNMISRTDNKSDRHIYQKFISLYS